MLTVYIDFKSAESYLALQPTLDLATELGIEIDWRPFLVPGHALPAPKPGESIGERHRRVRADSRRRIFRKYAAHQGIDLRFQDPSGFTDLTLGVLAGLEGDRLAFIRAAFDAYWKEQHDLNDPGVVEGLLGQPPDREAAQTALSKQQADAEDAGIVDAPAFLIKDQLSIGREHFPWIRELLST